jgi:hypothetical protein
MAKQKKNELIKLDVAQLHCDDEVYALFAICATYSDLRMAWLLNHTLHIDFMHVADVAEDETCDEDAMTYPIFAARHPALELTFVLLTNRQHGGQRLKEFNGVDYLLRISGRPDEEYMREVSTAIRALHHVSACMTVDNLDLKMHPKLTQTECYLRDI